MEFLINFANNILANIVFFLLGGFAIILVIRRKIQQKNDFFGITFNKQIFIYLSNIILEDAEVTTHFGEKDKYSGNVLIEHEFRVIPEITPLFPNSFSSDRPLSALADTFASLVNSYVLVQRPSISYIPSPKFLENSEMLKLPKNSTVICVGSMAYNSVSRYYQTTESPVFHVIKDNKRCQVELVQNRISKQVFHRDLHGKRNDIGTLIKLRDKNKNTVFIAAGLGVNATCAAVVFLAKNWQYLHKQYTNSEFGVFIECDHVSKNLNGYENPNAIFEVKGKDFE